MALKHPQLIEALTKVIASKPYAPIKLVYRQDHNKLLEEMKGNPRPQAGSFFYRGLIDIAKFAYERGSVGPVPPKPTPVPPAYVKVAPRATNPEGGSNVQYCMYNEDGSLRPGVTDHGNDNFSDESGATYHEGLQTSGIRDENYVVPGLPGSRGMDGRSPCQCLKDAGYPGDPMKNTGAWHI